MKKHSIQKKISDGVLAVIVMLFVITSAVVVTLNFTPLYHFDVKHLNVPATSGMTEEAIIENYDALIAYNSMFFGGELVFPSLPMSKEGQVHFVEVKNIFVAVQVLALVSAVLLILGGWYKLRKKEPGFLVLGAALTVAVPAIFGALIALNWQTFFITFHKLFFRNDYWIFDMQKDPVILILPDTFFMHCALMILGLAALLSLLAFLLGQYLKRRTQRRASILPETNTSIKPSEVLEMLRKVLSRIDKRLVEHGDRVTFIMYSMLKNAGKLQDYDLEKLLTLGIVHDIGAQKTDEIEEMLELETGDIMRHSIYGYLFLKHLSPLGSYSEAILYHHTSYERLLVLHPEHMDYAQMLFLADRMDVEWQDQGGKVDYEQLRLAKGKRFAPELVEMFIRADEEDGIIKQCASGAYKESLSNMFGQLNYSGEEILAYLRMVVCTIDFVSAQTVTHTVNTTLISVKVAEHMGFSGRALDVINYGAFLHDIGKISIPTAILESPSRLTPKEMEIMRTHVAITDEILMGTVTDEIRHIAARHHEKLDGTGYPNGLVAIELSIPERIVAVADILSALIGVRSYKSSMQKEEVVGILGTMCASGKLDKDICALVFKHYDEIVAYATAGQNNIVAIYKTIYAEYNEVAKRFEIVS